MSKRSLMLLVPLALLVGLGFGLYQVISGQPEGAAVPTTAVGIHVAPGQRHAPYSTTPPTSGPHYNIPGLAPTSWGIYDKPVPNEVQVHNLEHGGVVIQYNPKTADLKLIAALKALFKTQPLDKFHEVKIILAPYPAMPQKVAFTSWGWIENFDSFNQEHMQRFISAHINKGPENVP